MSLGPLPRAVGLAAVGLVPAALAVLTPSYAWACLAIDVALVVLVAIDFLRAPRLDLIRIERQIEPVISAGIVNKVQLRLELTSDAAQQVEGELRESVPPGPLVEGHRAFFATTRGEAIVAVASDTAMPTRRVPRSRARTLISPQAPTSRAAPGTALQCGPDLPERVVDALRHFPTGRSHIALATCPTTDQTGGVADQLACRPRTIRGDGADQRHPYPVR